MIWPVMLLVGLVVFGSVYWLKPSPRDKRLAELRLDAIKRKLQVRQFTYKPDSAKTGIRDDITGTSYTLMDNAKRNDSGLRWRVAGQGGWDTEGLPEGLAWHNQGTADDAARLTAALAELNDDLLLVEVFGNRVTMIPAERKTATAESYQRFLEALLPR
ncbi:hypothetical protein [uncultured Thalassolituus sp.]|uniref:hypothetical protein n=1 Tax=uncultured Thalassolituus sp. TaxID=285273 RepID=UPI002624B66E|nr:hypothetical protein [uncultured Thalassolituus sp.]